MATNPFVWFLGLFALVTFLTPALAQRSTVAGTVLYDGSPVTANPKGVPTLNYNCAKLPALCTNVNKRHRLESYGQHKYGPLIGNDHILMHYDTDKTRKLDRRDSVCTGTWKLSHPCPESAQPNSVPAGKSYKDSYPAQRYNPNNNIPFGGPGYNKIADAQGGESGMMWTCDEWPPAMSMEGGAKGNAQTICAPQNAACDSSITHLVKTNSEQDFQRGAHSDIGKHAVYDGANNPGYVWEFHFKTQWLDEGDVPATFVEWWDDPDTSFHNGHQKREPGAKQRVVHEYYSNSTVVVKRYPVDEENSKRSNGNNTAYGPVHQSFDTFNGEPPPLPIIDITRAYIEEQSDQPVHYYKDQMLSPDVSKRLSSSALIQDDAGECSADSPCPDGSCCNNDGKCGFGPENCGDGNCTSNCDATAFCGKDSEGGSVKCPLNVCCSFYGYCGVGDEFCTSPNPDAPCQDEFGSCEIVPVPSCGGDSANGRTIGYYQVANTRERQCNRITPSQIDTTGLTHLNLAFASIDPSSYEVVPFDAADAEVYKEFTDLKTDTLKTWIAIGGWNFNDPGPTQTTFSDLASTAEGRTKFINSCKSFMDEYGFNGVDLDWEYPGAPDRAGKDEDIDNMVTLIKEMRESLGTDYGLSLTLPSSYWYLRWFKPKEIEPNVDFLNLMTYDLHGPWDKDVKHIGQVVYGQTNIPEIYNWTQPLWYDGVDPANVNMGLAYYARGYTLANPACNSVGCEWKDESRPGPCTNFAGVMSLREIERLIPQLDGVEPELLEEDMMKQLTWGDQWIGYDDMETIKMKKQWASSHCFGGTMIWSVDLYSGEGSGDVPDGGGSNNPGSPGGGGGQNGGGDGDSDGGSGLVFIDPSIWEEEHPEIHCEPPCTFVLPPKVLDDPTTFTFPPYTTSLDVAWTGEGGEWTSTVQTTTLDIPPLTTTAIDVWAFTVSNWVPDVKTDEIMTSFYVTSSILPNPFVITNDRNPESTDGVTHPIVTRTITAPPSPYTFTQPDPTTTTTDDDGGAFPIVTVKPGKPGPICKSGCGSECHFFCGSPCLVDCVDGGLDFPDPSNPNPPPKPPPKPPTPDPPQGTSQPSEPPEDENGDDPQNEEQEIDDQACAREFDLPLPTFDDGSDGPSSTGTETVTDSPTSTSKDPPNPTPPTPNRDTEEVDCYDSGSWIDRAEALKAVKKFCIKHDGTTLDDTKDGTKQTLKETYGGWCLHSNSCLVDIEMSITVTNGCKFIMAGNGGTKDMCGRIFREIIDECDTSSTQYKQGGTLEGNCFKVNFDPNTRDI